MFWNSLESFGDRVALIDTVGSERALSYVELAEAADGWKQRIDAAWSSKFKDGDPPKLLIAIAIENQIDAIAAYIGALRGNHTVLLTDTGTLDDDGRIVETYQPNAVIRQNDGIWGIETKETRPKGAIHPDLSVLLSTSGTTGDPKLVRLSSENIDSNAASIAEYLGVTDADRAMSTLPLHYSYGMSVLNSYLSAGASLVLTDESIVSNNFWDSLQKHEATSLALVPYQFDLLDNCKFAEKTLPTLRYITQAGGKLPAEKIEKYADLGKKMGFDLSVMYGQTEAAPRISYIPVDELSDNTDSIGLPVPGGRLWIAGEGGAEITAPGASGELMYEGPNVMMGYATARAHLSNGDETSVLQTGDIAELKPNGFFKIVGRLKRFVKIYGLRLSLDELEQVIHDAGCPNYCVGSDDRLVVFCREAGAEEVVRDCLAEAYGLQSDAVLTTYLADVPLLPNGKVDYKTLQSTADKLAAETPVVEEKASGDLKDIVAKALRAPHVTPKDSFNSLGGDSLAYIQVTMALEDRLGYAPQRWEDMPIGQIEALQPSKSRFSYVGMDVVVRIVAVSLIVLHHLTRMPIGGGTWVLITVMGYSFVRFQMTLVNSQRFGQIAYQLLYQILPVYILILLSYTAFWKPLDIRYFLLLGNYYAAEEPNFFGLYWFVSLFVQLVAVLLLLFSIRPIREAFKSNPWQSCLVGVCVALILSGLYQFSLEDVTAAVDVREQKIRSVRHILTCLPFVVLGALIFYSNTLSRKRVAAIACLAAVAIFPEHNASRILLVVGGCVLLLSDWKLPAPHWLSRSMHQMASVSLYVYLFHNLIVHLFRYQSDFYFENPLLLTAPLALALSFGMAYFAKSCFEWAESSVGNLRDRAAFSGRFKRQPKHGTGGL